MTIEFEDNHNSKTLFKNKKITYNPSGYILLAPLLESIKDEGIDMKNHIVSYYSHVDKVFVHVGKDPIKHSEQTSAIHPFELDSKKPL